MIGPSSYVSKALLTLLLLLALWYAYMDMLLYARIRNYPVDRSLYNAPATQSTSSGGGGSIAYLNRSITTTTSTTDAHPIEYASIVWLPCTINPLCDVTIKALMLDHTNQYLFAPAATLFDRMLGLTQCTWISPNAISVLHVFVAIAAGRLVASDSLSQRRWGVVLFQVRTFLDDLDGHVARQRKNVRGERSEIGTAGYYIDGLCDALGCVALLLGIFVHLRNNPPRRGYTQLQAVLLPMTVHHAAAGGDGGAMSMSTSSSSAATSAASCQCSDSSKTVCAHADCGGGGGGGITYKAKHKVPGAQVARHVLVLGAQLLVSSTGWNRYIALYQQLLESNEVSSEQCARQTFVLRSQLFFCVTWLWRVANPHALLHALLLAVFCDRLWCFLRAIQWWMWAVLGVVVCVTEMHVMDVEQFVRGATTAASAAAASTDWAMG